MIGTTGEWEVMDNPGIDWVVFCEEQPNNIASEKSKVYGFII